jgi:hypothetical protein
MQSDWNLKSNYLFNLPEGQDFCIRGHSRSSNAWEFVNPEFITNSYPVFHRVSNPMPIPLSLEDATGLFRAEIDNNSRFSIIQIVKISRYLPQHMESPVVTQVVKERRL